MSRKMLWSGHWCWTRSKVSSRPIKRFQCFTLTRIPLCWRTGESNVGSNVERKMQSCLMFCYTHSLWHDPKYTWFKTFNSHKNLSHLPIITLTHLPRNKLNPLIMPNIIIIHCVFVPWKKEKIEFSSIFYSKLFLPFQIVYKQLAKLFHFVEEILAFLFRFIENSEEEKISK